MMECKMLFLTLFAVLPSLWAFPTGAPTDACTDLMPQHGVQGVPNNGFIIMSDVIDDQSYVPGQTYEVTLVGLITGYRGFFIQARAGDSIVGTWRQMSGQAQTVSCLGASQNAITHTSSSLKSEEVFLWTAPPTDVGEIDFIYSIVVAFANIMVRLNATEERVPLVVPPPNPPPADAVFFNSYGQPENRNPNENFTFSVEWRPNNNLFADFRMQGEAVGWIALGITTENLALNNDTRSFTDILLCQVDKGGDVVNVKDFHLEEGGSLILMRDSSENGTEDTSGEIDDDGRIYCSFSRVVFALGGQEEEDASFSEDNYLFFLSGNDRGNSSAIPADFSTAAMSDVVFSSRRININQGFAFFAGNVNDLPGEGRFPTANCDPEDCDFYFRWGVNPTNPNYLTFHINADITRGWAAVGVSTDRRMGGDEIDDIFGCTTVDNPSPQSGDVFADTYNVAGGDRQNVGDDSLDAGLIPHDFGIFNGRFECTFSRLISVHPGEESSDFNLDASYYIIIGTGDNPGTPFSRHERNPEWSTSQVNLVRETSVDFDYARIPLIRTHGILMIFAWPVLAWLGIGMARHMKPALPNGGWFLLHRILVISSLVFTCISFALIFIAFRNTEVRGLITLGDLNEVGTAHFVIGIAVVVLQLSNPIIALFRCHPGADNRWIFNVIHGVFVGAGAEILSGINILLGLYLFGDKIIDPEDFDPFLAFWLMIALVVAFGIVDFSLYVFFLISRYACEDRTVAMESENIEMKQYGSSGGHDAPKPKKDPSQDSWIRWIGWIVMAAIVISLGLAIIVLVAIG